jgi:hypothetical protein
MSETANRLQAAREAIYCERILAKSGSGVVSAMLGGDATFVAMQHYPPGDIYDPDSGAQAYYHAHDAGPRSEHGHFHCFLRPDGKDGPVHHLVALGMDHEGRLARLFTVNRWVTGDTWIAASPLAALLPRFDLQLAKPDYLANRWLTAVLAVYHDDIIELLHRRDEALAARGGETLLEDRSIEILSERPVDLDETATQLSGSPPAG